MKKRAHHSFFQSFSFAYKGIGKAIRRERNLKIHLGAAIIAIILGFILKISSGEWLILVLTISLVISAEIFNTSLEAGCDLIKARLDLNYYETYWIRNFAAAAVLVLAIGALAIGMIIFLPKILW